jgi:hypothetical protein
MTTKKATAAEFETAMVQHLIGKLAATQRATVSNLPKTDRELIASLNSPLLCCSLC